MRRQVSWFVITLRFKSHNIEVIYLRVTIWVDHLTSNYNRQNKVTGGGVRHLKKKYFNIYYHKVIERKKDAAVAFFKTQQFLSFSTKLTHLVACVPHCLFITPIQSPRITKMAIPVSWFSELEASKWCRNVFVRLLCWDATIIFTNATSIICVSFT